jgi:DNA-binding CsgD family transcriptional regulator
MSYNIINPERRFPGFFIFTFVDQIFHMFLFRSLSLVFFLLFCYRLQGTEITQYHEIKNFISGNIEIENQNWGIFQHPETGFLYFANSEGLIEYDGLTSNTYKIPFNKGIRSVCIDDLGLIFTGGFEEFGYWKRNAGCQLEYSSLIHQIEVEKNDEIWKIYHQAGKIYFQSFTSIYVYDYKTVKKFKARFTQLFMFPKEKGFLVQILGLGLFSFENEVYAEIHGSSLFATMKIHTIVPYQRDSYLIGTANNGLYLLKNGKIEYFPCEASEFLKYNTCNAGVAINDSLFVFGTILNGIVEFNARGKIKRTFNFSNGLKNNTVLSLFKDRNHGLWVGLDQGINYLATSSPIVQYTNVTGTLGTIYTILKKDKLLYIGTNQGLFSANIENSNEYYTFSNVRMIPGSQGQVWTLGLFDNQVLCGHNEGTFLVEGNSFRKISDITGGWTLKTLRGNILQGTYTGLVLLDKDASGKWKFRNKIRKYNEPSRHVEVDYMGFIWASHHQRGIYKIELDEKLDSVKNSKFFDGITGVSGNIDVFKINNRIVFTGADSLYTFDYDANKIIPFKILNDQLKEFSKAAQIVPFEDSKYWFVFDNKIALFDISRDFKTTKLLEFNQKNIHSPGNDLEISRMDSRNILFPNHSGFVIFDITNSKKIVDSPQILIHRLQFQGKGKTLEYCNFKNLKAPFYQNNITVYFADPSRFNMEEKQYYYRIPELEDQWHTTSISNFNYNNVRFGNYTVQIKPDINAPVTSLKFTIKAPWYLTYYAFTIYFLLFILFVYIGFRIFRYELNKQKRLVEMEVRRHTLENELDIKSNELMLTMRYLIQKNEILTELKEEIDALKEHSAKYPVKPIKNLEKIIYQGLDTQTESWKSAMNNLKLSEQGFFRRLKEKHPELTPNDLRLCSYLRMNFTTKEIAHLLNISGRGVEIGRYRLRKKMNLPHDVNLSEYLMES